MKLCHLKGMATITLTVNVSHICDCHHFVSHTQRSGSKTARALLGGHATKAVLEQDNIKKAIIRVLLEKLYEERIHICKKNIASPSAQFQWISCQTSKWKTVVADIEEKATFSHSVLHSIKHRNGRRNTVKIGAAHCPRIRSPAAILLKERNIEMCGQQSLVHLLMLA